MKGWKTVHICESKIDSFKNADSFATVFMNKYLTRSINWCLEIIMTGVAKTDKVTANIGSKLLLYINLKCYIKPHNHTASLLFR